MPNKVGQLVEDMPNSILRDKSKGHRDRVAHQADYDADRRFELFLLDEGQKKVEQKDETRKLLFSSALKIPPYPPNSLLEPLSSHANTYLFPTQAPRTPLSSPSTKKTTRLATCSPSACTSTTTSSSQPTKSRIRSSRPSSCASPPMGPRHLRRPSFYAARMSSRISRL